MPLQHGAHMTQRIDRLFGEIAALRERPIKRWRRMPLGQYQPIPPVPMRVGRVNVHFLKIQVGQRVRNGKGTAGMPAFRMERSPDDIHPDTGGRYGQLFLFGGFHQYVLPFFFRF